MAHETDAVLVNWAQVDLQVPPAVEVALLASLAVQTMLGVVMLPHRFPQADGKGEGFLAALVIAHRIEVEMGDHLGIHAPDVRALAPELGGHMAKLPRHGCCHSWNLRKDLNLNSLWIWQIIPLFTQSRMIYQKLSCHKFPPLLLTIIY
jgi:hypothetical protein